MTATRKRRRNAGRRARAGRAGKLGDRHRQPTDRLPRNVARRIRRRGGDAWTADDRIQTARSSIPCCTGCRRGERVVTSGSFLVDAETRLNPAAGSIYFGGSGGSQGGSTNVTTVRPIDARRSQTPRSRRALAKLPPDDRTLAEAQKFCPVLNRQSAWLDGDAGQADDRRPSRCSCAAQAAKKGAWPIPRRRWPRRIANRSKADDRARQRSRRRSPGGQTTEARTVAIQSETDAMKLKSGRLAKLSPADRQACRGSAVLRLC